MKNKNKFIEDFLSRQGYGCILSSDRDIDPWIAYFPHSKNMPRYVYYYNKKKYYEQTKDVYYTPAQFVRYIKRLENLISFW